MVLLVLLKKPDQHIFFNTSQQIILPVLNCAPGIAGAASMFV